MTAWSDLTPLERWQALATSQGHYAAAALKGRPAANAQPDDIGLWCKANKLSPVFAFPEFGWKFSGDTATAGYDLGTNDHVAWTAHSDGSNSFDHVWGGASLGQLIDEAVTAVAILADVSGFVGVGALLHTAQAVADHKPIGQLGQALKQDWDALANNAQLTFSVLDGDWGKAWDAATNDGKALAGIVAAFGGLAPDRSGKLTLTAASVAPAPAGPAGPTYGPGLSPVQQAAHAMGAGVKRMGLPSSGSSAKASPGIVVGVLAAIAGVTGAVWAFLRSRLGGRS